jgi:hypothetical protein
MPLKNSSGAFLFAVRPSKSKGYSIMKRVFTSTNVAEVGLLCGLFKQEGIECFTRNERLSMATGSVPFLECMPELWILKDEDESRALDLVDSWQNKDSEPALPWVCPQCGQNNEGQFGACWKCGFEIDG